MAYDYEKVKQAYEGLDTQQKQKFADMMKWSGNYADFMSRYNAEKTPTATASTTTANSSTPAQTSTSTSRNIAKPEYQWTWSIWTKTSPYENQGEWNYYYSNQTNRYEKYPTATQTSTQTTKVETPAENDTVKQLRDAWNNKSYAEQQKLLKSNPAMQNTLTKYWITNKQPEATPAQTPTETPTAQKDKGWDYQDNSQARMDEIIRNLDWFRVTDPYLFDNYDTFYNAFIAGKGRSQDQIKTLNDYYDKMKQYNKYDNLSSDEVGWMIARWEIPDDYLNYLKNSDPQRWAEIQWVRKDVEDQIMNESYLDTIATDAWFDMWESDFMKWQKWTFWLDDKNSDWLWDIIYHAPTQEELDLNNEDNEYEAEKLRIKNAYKDLQSDLADQYPDADLSTIMVLAWDRGNKMMKALDSISVAQTKTQWRLKYLQNERAEMDKAWQTQINELQQNLWMYYDYTPQWIAELAQAKYWATNITLDQADSWNETQKQMALQSVLDDYYAKYGSIIQRSEQQVINDVIAYAKKNWIWLAQALQENFVKPLQQKPQFATLSSWWTLWWAWTDKWDTVKITWADWKEKTVLYNQATWEVKNVDWTAYDWAIKTTAVWWATFKPVSKSAQTQALASVQSEYWTWSTYKNWWCWELANLYLQRMWSDIHLWDKIADKTKYITTKVWEWLPNVWDLVVRDFSSNPKASKVSQESWHVAVVTDVYKDWSFDVYQQNWDWKHTVWTAHIPNTNYVAWYIDPTAVSWWVWWAWWAWDYSSANYMDYETWVLNFIPIQLRNTEKEQEKIVTKIKSYYDRWLWQTEAALVQMWFNVQKATPEGKNVANRIVDMLSYVADEEAFDTTFMTMVSNDVNNWKYSEALKKTENMVYKYIQQSWQNAVSKTDIADAAVALSSLNKYKNNWSWLNNSTLTLENIISAWGKKVEQFNVRQANLINTLEWLWYSEEMAQQLVPNLTMSRSAFVWKMDALQNLIIDRYNRQRWEYWMPPVNLAVLLWSQSLSTAYWVNSEWEALQVF